MISLVFFGTPDIGLKSLEHFYNSDKFDVLAVVTQPDKPSGRGHKLTPSPIKQFALEHNIKVFQPKSIRKEPEIIEALKELKPDFFVISIGYLRQISPQSSPSSVIIVHIPVSLSPLIIARWIGFAPRYLGRRET